MKRLLQLLVGLAVGLVLGAGAAALASRTSGGTMSLYTPGNPVVSGTSISSSWANNTLSDLANEITNSLDRQGRGGMLAPLKLTTGTAAAPSLSFTSGPACGLYYAGANNPAMSVNGTQVESWTGTGAAVNGSFSVSGALSTSSTFAAIGAISGPSLAVTGAVSSTSVLTPAITATSTLTLVAPGGVSVSSTLAVSGTSTLVGPVAASSTLSALGLATLSGGASVTGAMTSTSVATGSLVIPAATGAPITGSYRGTQVWNTGSMAAYATASINIAVTGTAAGADCLPYLGSGFGGKCNYWCTTTTDTCNIAIYNASSTAVTCFTGTAACRTFNP